MADDKCIDKDKKVAEKANESLTEGPANRDRTGRKTNGQFAKGVSGNPNGRPKMPDEIKLYGKEAPARLRAIADDPDTPIKVKADIERWFAEMAFGKAVQQQIVDASVMQKPVVFAGEDEIAE